LIGMSAAFACLVTQASPVAPPPAAAPAHARRSTIAAVGDVMFGRYKLNDEGERSYRPVVSGEAFGYVAPMLSSADIAFANVETPVMTEPDSFRVHPRLTFRADPARAKELARAGFDVVSLANNHVHNLGGGGAPQSRMHLQAAGVASAGAGIDPIEAFRPAIQRAGGLQIAFLAFTVWHNARPPVAPDGAVAHLTEADLLLKVPGAVRAARAQLGVDFVVVSVHWGIEFEAHPTAKQVTAAHALVDAGADLILGHHPHVVQDFELYHGAVIAYSLGNFVFDEGFLSRRQTVVLHATFDGSGTFRRVTNVALTPILIGHRDHIPRPATGADYKQWQQSLRALAPGIEIRPAPESRLRASR